MQIKIEPKAIVGTYIVQHRLVGESAVVRLQAWGALMQGISPSESDFWAALLDPDTDLQVARLATSALVAHVAYRSKLLTTQLLVPEDYLPASAKAAARAAVLRQTPPRPGKLNQKVSFREYRQVYGNAHVQNILDSIATAIGNLSVVQKAMEAHGTRLREMTTLENTLAELEILQHQIGEDQRVQAGINAIRKLILG